MKNALIGVCTLLFLAVPYIAYQNLVVIPKQQLADQRERVEREILEKRVAEEKRIADYNQCTSTAWQTYSNNWDMTCENLDLEKDCSLPTYLSEGLDERHEQGKDRCLNLYK